jgi:hypothetical protein
VDGHFFQLAFPTARPVLALNGKLVDELEGEEILLDLVFADGLATVGAFCAACPVVFNPGSDTLLAECVLARTLNRVIKHLLAHGAVEMLAYPANLYEPTLHLHRRLFLGNGLFRFFCFASTHGAD